MEARFDGEREVDDQEGECQSRAQHTGAPARVSGPWEESAMITKHGDRTDEVEELLERGLDLYGRNEIDDAVLCWRKALAIDPENARAKDFLDCAGVQPEPLAEPGKPLGELAEVIDLDELRTQWNFSDRITTPSSPSSRSSADDDEPAPTTQPRPVRRSMIEQLLKEEKHEEALELLYRSRAHHPSDAGLSRSIRLLRERLALGYAAALRNLDWIPTLVDPTSARNLDPQERQVVSLIDGISSYGDIVASSPLGRLNTLRILSRLLDCAFIRPQPLDPNLPSISASSHSAESAALREGPVGIEAPIEPGPAPSEAVVSGPTVSEPSISGPASSGPTVSGPTVSGPAVSGPAVSGPASSGPSISGPSIVNGSDHDSYEKLFSEATAAYLIRDYRRAVELFTECCRRRPDDRRAQHNKKALQKRFGTA